MRTIFTKQPKHLARNSLAVGIAHCDNLRVRAKPLQSISKNVISAPE
ncbi:hypothetical protein [Parapedobacter pyrenivorans]|nr:hypothetical protein [Parapedobacter pyrenivorans]